MSNTLTRLFGPMMLVAAAAPLAFSQSTFSIGTYGYTPAPASISVAPGQLIVVSVFGLNTRLSGPVIPLPDNTGYPTVLKGISVDFVQGNTTVQLGIQALQQSACPATGTCSPSTSITLQIPFDLQEDSGIGAMLRVKENGTTAGEVPIHPVTDSIHVLNTCDQTQVYISAAYNIPSGTCVPVVMHAHGPLVTTDAPAKPGETLLLFAYGLGALDRPMTSSCCASPEEFPLAVQPVSMNFHFGGYVGNPQRSFTGVAPAYAGFIGVDMYQVNFTVPAITDVLPACSGSPVSNLTVMVAGPHSSDTADICVRN